MSDEIIACTKCNGLGEVDPRAPIQAIIEDADVERQLRVGRPPNVTCDRCKGHGLTNADGSPLAMPSPSGGEK